jgi:hypothetical protein
VNFALVPRFQLGNADTESSGFANKPELSGFGFYARSQAPAWEHGYRKLRLRERSWSFHDSAFKKEFESRKILKPNVIAHSFSRDGEL